MWLWRITELLFASSCARSFAQACKLESLGDLTLGRELMAEVPAYLLKVGRFLEIDIGSKEGHTSMSNAASAATSPSADSPAATVKNVSKLKLVRGQAPAPVPAPAPAPSASSSYGKASASSSYGKASIATGRSTAASGSGGFFSFLQRKPRLGVSWQTSGDLRKSHLLAAPKPYL